MLVLLLLLLLMLPSIGRGTFVLEDDNFTTSLLRSKFLRMASLTGPHTGHT